MGRFSIIRNFSDLCCFRIYVKIIANNRKIKSKVNELLLLLTFALLSIYTYFNFIKNNYFLRVINLLQFCLLTTYYSNHFIFINTYTDAHSHLNYYIYWTFTRDQAWVSVSHITIFTQKIFIHTRDEKEEKKNENNRNTFNTCRYFYTLMGPLMVTSSL